MKRIRLSRPRHSTVAAYLALSVALGGTSYAAVTLPKNSVGSKQIKKNAVRSKHVRNHSLLARDFKAGQIPRGASGPQGVRGPQGVPGLQGVQGQTGPGALSFDGPFPADLQQHVVTTINGMDVEVMCGVTPPPANIPVVEINVVPSGAARVFYGFGTTTSDGGAPADASSDPSGGMTAGGNSVAKLDVVAEASAAGEPVKFTRFDLSAVRGSVCTVRGLVVPGDPAR